VDRSRAIRYPSLLELVRRRGRLAVAGGVTAAALACGSQSTGGTMAIDWFEPDTPGEVVDAPDTTPEVEVQWVDTGGIIEAWAQDETQAVPDEAPKPDAET